MSGSPVSDFIEHHFRHFNAATLLDAAKAYRRLIEDGGKMFLAMAGAMSTAELGVSLAEMIREERIHAISCTGANLEEDLFNLVAHDHYVRIPNYRDLTPEEEKTLLERQLSRVTDTCIPENEAMRVLESVLMPRWMEADRRGERRFPHEFLYEAIRAGDLEPYYEIDPRDSWVVAACEKNLPIFVPGWEDSTLGNAFAAAHMEGKISRIDTVKSGLEAFVLLGEWYREVSADHRIGFFQIGGGIAGDFAICVVPMLRQDLRIRTVPVWSYFCQISDSTTSFGSYSGAVPNEKITWDKLDVDTPRFVIESDATIVAPLVFAYVLGK
jgi:deoxyhypusine synthase